MYKFQIRSKCMKKICIYFIDVFCAERKSNEKKLKKGPEKSYLPGAGVNGDHKGRSPEMRLSIAL